MFKLLLGLASLLAVSLFPTILCYSNSPYDISLDFTETLNIFRECLIQIHLFRLVKGKNYPSKPSKRESYNSLILPSLPVVLMSTDFEIQKPFPFLQVCKKLRDDSVEPSSGSFLKYSFSRQKCGVFVHVDPPFDSCYQSSEQFDFSPSTLHYLANTYPTSMIFAYLRFNEKITIWDYREGTRFDDWYKDARNRSLTPISSQIVSSMIKLRLPWRWVEPYKNSLEGRSIKVSHAISLYICQDLRIQYERMKRNCGHILKSESHYSTFSFTACAALQVIGGNFVLRKEEKVNSLSIITKIVDSHCKNTVWLPFWLQEGNDIRYTTKFIHDKHLMSSLGFSQTTTLSALIVTSIFGNITFLMEALKGSLYEKSVWLNTFIRNEVQAVHFVRLNHPLAITEVSHTGKSQEIHFVMCSPIVETDRLSFTGYFSAFRSEVWLILGVNVLIGIVIHVQSLSSRMTCAGLKNVSVGTMFQASGKIYKILLGQSTSILGHRWFWGGWILAGIFLTNLYIGDNIDQLTAPIRKWRLESFEQIINKELEIYSPTFAMDHTFNRFRFKYAGDVTEDKPGIMNPEYVKETMNNVEKYMGPSKFELIYYFKMFKESENEIQQVIDKLVRKPSTIEHIRSVYEGLYFFNVTNQCRSQAYVDEYDKVQDVKLRLLAHLKDKRLSDNVVVSKEKLGSLYNHIYLKPFPISYASYVKKVHSFLESGIGDLWIAWMIRLFTWRNIHLDGAIEDKMFSPVKLEGNFRVIFCVHFAFLLIAFLIFVMENLKTILHRVKIIWNYINRMGHGFQLFALEVKMLTKRGNQVDKWVMKRKRALNARQTYRRGRKISIFK